MKFRLVLTGVLMVLTAQMVVAQATGQTSSSQLQSPEMNLQFDGSLPAAFRGGNPDEGVVHVLEDGTYKRQEHTLLYEETPQAMGATSSAKFDGPPTINWTTERVNADGTVETLANDNNNSATSNSEFPEPGEYRVGNSGARQVSTSGGGATDTENGATTTGTGGATGTGTGGAAGTGTAGATGTGNGEATTQRVTSTQTTGVVCHDITTPSLWAVIQEGAGSTKLVDSEETLKNSLRTQILATKGQFQPDLALSGDLKGSNLMAVFEFPVNKAPVEKTAAVTVKGAVFNELGKEETKPAGMIPMKVLDRENQTRVTEVSAMDQLKGIFVRRNIPFLVAGMVADNGDKFASAGDVACKVAIKGGAEVEKVDGAYLFRVPNYPRSEFADQPEYEFIMEGADKDGNKTVVRLPLCVMNTQMSYEGGKNE